MHGVSGFRLVLGVSGFECLSGYAENGTAKLSLPCTVIKFIGRLLEK